jgi:isochorismate hydrolase
MLNPSRLDADQAMLLIIDMQAKLLPLIDDDQEVAFQTEQLLRGAGIFNLPVLATEQYPQGIGSTVASVAELLAGVEATVLEKDAFSACGDDQVRGALRRIDRPQVIVCGIEAHVCVLQTALDLVSMDHGVFVCADAIGSRRRLDWEWGLARMQQAGAAVTTTEAVLFELCERCRSDRFKQLLELIKASDARRG